MWYKTIHLHNISALFYLLSRLFMYFANFVERIMNIPQIKLLILLVIQSLLNDSMSSF